VLINPAQVWLRLALASLALAGCRGGASPPRRSPASPPVPMSRPAAPSAPSDAGFFVVRDYPLTIQSCFSPCDAEYERCKRVTPECEAYTRLGEARRRIHWRDAGRAELEAYSELLSQLLGRSDVCVRTCGEAERLCERRCFDAVDAAVVHLPVR
jgi:hypothetical protein